MFKNTKFNKGESEVIGFVLLVSLAVILSVVVVSLAVVDGGMISELNNQVEENQLDSNHTRLAAGQSITGYNKSKSNMYNIGADTELRETSSIDIYTIEDGSETLFYEEQMNALVTEREDRTIYTESGGVFVTYKDSTNVHIRSNPSLSYDDRTLTLPMVKFYSENETHSNNITLSYKDTNVAESINVESNKIKIIIQGETYRAWGEVFSNSFNTDVTYNDDQNKVIIIVGIEDRIVKQPSDGIESSGTVSVNNNSSINGSVSSSGTVTGEENITGNVSESTNTDYYSTDTYIREKMKILYKNGEHTTINNGDVIDSGEYYVDGDIVLDDSTTIFNAQKGDITIGVEGDVYISNDALIKIKNTTDNRTVEFIVDGEEYVVSEGSPTVEVTDGHSGHHKVFGSSSTYFQVSQKATWSGVYYSPSSTATSTKSGRPNKGNGGGSKCKNINVSACIGGNATVNGSVIAGDVSLGQSSTLNYDENLGNYEILGNEFQELTRPDVNYLHISTTTVEIDK